VFLPSAAAAPPNEPVVSSNPNARPVGREGEFPTRAGGGALTSLCLRKHISNEGFGDRGNKADAEAVDCARCKELPEGLRGANASTCYAPEAAATADERDSVVAIASSACYGTKQRTRDAAHACDETKLRRRATEGILHLEKYSRQSVQIGTLDDGGE
jgi:hypothetical protein